MKMYIIAFILLLHCLPFENYAQEDTWITENDSSLKTELKERMRISYEYRRTHLSKLEHRFFDSVCFSNLKSIYSKDTFTTFPKVIQYSIMAYYHDSIIYSQCNIVGNLIPDSFKNLIRHISLWIYDEDNIYYDKEVIKVIINALIVIDEKDYIVTKTFELH